MSKIDTKSIQKIREETGASIMDCKRALEKSGGDEKIAIQILQSEGKLKAQKKSNRKTKEGIVESYIHSNKKMGVLVELRCETDFVAKNEEFQKLAHDIAMHIAASNPLYLKPEDIPPEIIENQKAIFMKELENIKKPKKIIDEIIDGKMNKYFSEICLLNQPFIKDLDKTINDLIQESIAKMGENIEIGRFVRFEI